MNRKLKKSAKISGVAIAVFILIYFFPLAVVAYVLSGLWDVSRNRALDLSVLKQYFFKNGITTWLASPINILLDICSLPYINKGVYRLDDLPIEYQTELDSLFRKAEQMGLVDQLQRKFEALPRAMCFFKWYGRNIKSCLEIPEFQSSFRYVRTIGVSMFRGHESTSRHFGPFRPCLRVLYCLNKVTDPGSYIQVGPVENRWMDQRVFIFDDTLLHQSFNGQDESRYVLFVDILRPSYLNFVSDFAVYMICLIFRGFNGVFYKNWKLVNN